MKINDLQNSKIGVIGLGYAGLPIALLFAEKYDVIGFDINQSRIEEINRQFPQEKLSALNLNIQFSLNKGDLRRCNILIVVVPTPVDAQFIPVTKYLENASEIVGACLTRGDIVIYESTVYPGATEEICAPILEKVSRLVLNKDFYLGYSPERISPGESAVSVRDIVKITSGSTIQTAKIVDALYKSVITAGTHLVSSIKVAEFSKVVENSQRDVNIAFINEIAIIADSLGIDFAEVLGAASTKWNFHHYKPGFVGGHCIAVDPYYLLNETKKVGYMPDLMTAARKVNECFSKFIADKAVKQLLEKKINLVDARVLIMGYTYKENCDDIRNTKVKDLVKWLLQLKIHVEVYDPMIAKEKLKHIQNSIENPQINSYDLIILAVGHTLFIKMGIEKIRLYGKVNSVVMDIKNLFPEEKDLLKI